MAEAYGFDREGVRRIVRSVRKSESTPRRVEGHRKPRDRIKTEERVLAKITDIASGGAPHYLAVEVFEDGTTITGGRVWDDATGLPALHDVNGGGAWIGKIVEAIPMADSTPALVWGFITAAVTFPAIITGSTLLGGATTNRWKYAWSEAEFTTATIIGIKSGGMSGTTTTDFAINVVEMFHTAQYAWGVDIDGADYPAGGLPMPVGGAGAEQTHKYNVPVTMHVGKASNGDTVRWFKEFWSHDGTCE